MKKSLFLLMLTASLGAYAANHEVKMLDNGKDGSMVFEPGYVNAKVGDTVTFKAANSGHWVQSKALPEGVADFLSEDGKDFTLKLDKEGVYVYTCPPHRMMNMSGVIQVGKPVNKAKAQAVVEHFDFVVGGVCAEGSGQHEEEEGFFHGGSPFCEEYKMVAGLVSWWQISQLGLPHRADNGQALAVV